MPDPIIKPIYRLNDGTVVDMAVHYIAVQHTSGTAAFRFLLSDLAELMPAGEDGAPGPPGEDGEDGAPGAMGPSGHNGPGVYAGDGPPGELDYSQYDFYIDKIAGMMYGPKLVSTWPTPFSIIGPPGLGFTPRGTWALETEYVTRDVVERFGSTYVRTGGAVTGWPPPNSGWELWAAKGDTGATGADGPPGVDGVDGDTGPPGAPGADGADGEDGAEGPPGSPGADGAPGAPGADGLPALAGVIDGTYGPYTTITIVVSGGQIVSIGGS